MNKDVNVYETGEPINVVLDIFSPRQYDNVQLMLIVIYRNGTRIGLSQSPTFRLDEGNSNVHFNLSTDCLPDGDYYTELNIVERTEYGSYEKYEGVEKAFSFQSKMLKDLLPVQEWLGNVWGHTLFNQIEIIPNKKSRSNI